MGMDQLKATHRKFTQSIYGWDVDPSGNLIPNWVEQNYIDFMKWQMEVNGLSAAAVARALNRQGVKGQAWRQMAGLYDCKSHSEPIPRQTGISSAILLTGESNLGTKNKQTYFVNQRSFLYNTN